MNLFNLQSGALDAILHDIHDLSKGIETMQMQTNQIYENIDVDEHPYRTEMSLVLSYNGNKVKYKSHDSDKLSDCTDIETPPPNIPQAMALLPNKLPYAATKMIANQNEFGDGEHFLNTENNANENLYAKSQGKRSQNPEAIDMNEDKPKQSNENDANPTKSETIHSDMKSTEQPTTTSEETVNYLFLKFNQINVVINCM